MAAVPFVKTHTGFINQSFSQPEEKHNAMVKQSLTVRRFPKWKKGSPSNPDQT